METKEEVKFVISYNGVTYDSDCCEYVTLNFKFTTLESAKDFKVNFPKWCYENGIASEDEVDWDRRSNSKHNYVSFQDVPEFGLNNLPFESFITLYTYDTGWFYLNENADIVMISKKVEKEIVG